MSVRAARAERGDPRAPWSGGPPKRRQLGVHVDRARCEIDFRIRLFVVDARRKLLVFQREDGLDERCHPRGFTEMTDVRFDRTDGTKLSLRCVRAERLSQRGDFDGIANRGSGSVGLDVADGLGFTPAIAIASAMARAWPSTLGAR